MKVDIARRCATKAPVTSANTIKLPEISLTGIAAQVISFLQVNNIYKPPEVSLTRIVAQVH